MTPPATQCLPSVAVAVAVAIAGAVTGMAGRLIPLSSAASNVFGLRSSSVDCHVSSPLRLIAAASVLGACWGTEELGWKERSWKKLRDVR